MPLARMNRRLTSVLTLLLLLALGLWAGRWFLDNFERRSEVYRGGFSSAARRNPLLAAQRLLQRLGLEAESLSGRDYLRSLPPELDRSGQGPAVPDILLVKDLGPSLAPPQEQRLLRWVASGGHLIATPGRLVGEGGKVNHLLTELGVRLIALERDEGEAQAPVQIDLPGWQESARVAFEASRALSFKGDGEVAWSLPAAEGYHLLTLRHGEGLITLLSDNRFLDNQHLEQQDNALLLAYLMQGGRRVWLLYSSQMPALPLLLWRYAPYLVVSIALLLPMLLWWMGRRCGPLLSRAAGQRRDLLEHLEVAAGFQWRLQRAQQLQRRNRQLLEQ